MQSDKKKLDFYFQMPIIVRSQIPIITQNRKGKMNATEKES